jgi:hypothetical protein
MTTKTINLETLKPQEIFSLAQYLSPADLHWLVEQFNRLIESKTASVGQSYLDTPSVQQLQAEFRAFEQVHQESLAEAAAFEGLKPELLKTHRGQFVAIYQGQVAGAGDDELELLKQMDQRFGNVPYYIELVAENTPRRARMPSVRVAKR